MMVRCEYGCEGMPAHMAARRSANSSIRPKLPSGFVKLSMRSRAMRAAFRSTGGIEMFSVIQTHKLCPPVYETRARNAGRQEPYAEDLGCFLVLAGKQYAEHRMQRSRMRRDQNIVV